MERAMQHSHGMGYEAYNRKFNNKLLVEKKREEDHKKAKEILLDVKSQLN